MEGAFNSSRILCHISETESMEIITVDNLAQFNITKPQLKARPRALLIQKKASNEMEKSCLNNQCFNISCNKESNLRNNNEKPNYRLEPVCQVLGYKDIYDCWTLHPCSYINYFLGFCLSLMCIYNLITSAIKGKILKDHFDLQYLVQLVIVIGITCFFFLSQSSIDIAVHIAGWIVFLVWIGNISVQFIYSVFNS